MTAAKIVLEPIFEADFHPVSFGFRPKRSAHQALEAVRQAANGGRGWVLDADIKACFDNIDHDALMAQVERRIVDRQMLKLLRSWLRAGVFEGGLISDTEAGTPQGSPVSPLLANIALHVLDEAWTGSGQRLGVLVRYCDDFVVLCPTRERAEAARDLAEETLEPLGLRLHPDKTRIADLRQGAEGFDFLGFHHRMVESWKQSGKVLGYHPLLATRADTGEVLHIRFRKGSANSGRGAERFVRELVGRVRRAGSSGPLTLRADSGFYSKFVVKACRDHKVSYSITARQTPKVMRAIDEIAEEDWIGIEYTDNGEAWVAEISYGDGHRLVVRRTKLADPQPALFATYRYHAFITDRVGDAVSLDADHRRHAVVELAIRDLKDGSGLSHCPSGNFSANGAWAVLATIAHNLIRWVGSLGLEISGPLVAKTIRRRFLTLPGRITHRSRRRQLHLPTAWPWAEQWVSCFERLVTLRI